MRLDPNELPEHIKRINPQLFVVGQLPAGEPKPTPARPLVSRGPGEQKSPTRMVVSFVRYGRKLLDSDNLEGSFKHIRDIVAQSLGIQDNDSRVQWEYGQLETKGRTGCTVKIEIL